MVARSGNDQLRTESDSAGPPPLLAGAESGQGLSAREIVDTLFRQKWRILPLFFLLLAATVAYIVLTPAQYESDMTILVKDKRVDLGLGPDTASKPESGASDTQIATEIQLLTSRELFREVVIKAGLAKSGSAAAVDLAVGRLKKEVRVSPVLKSSLIQVRYSDSQAERAARVLQILASLYLSRHLELHSSPGSLEFFTRQADEYEKKLREAHQRLVEFQTRTRIVLLPEQKDLTL